VIRQEFYRPVRVVDATQPYRPRTRTVWVPKPWRAFLAPYYVLDRFDWRHRIHRGSCRSRNGVGDRSSRQIIFLCVRLRMEQPTKTCRNCGTLISGQGLKAPTGEFVCDPACFQGWSTGQLMRALNENAARWGEFFQQLENPA